MRPIYKTQVHPLEVYFSRLRDIRGAGIGQNETSYYDALATLLTTYGRKLNPRVTCVMQIRNQGAGIPDGGLFTAEQLRGHRDRAEQVPSRGVIEAKAFNADVERVSQTEQVRNYLGRYGLVLVTNFREFLLLDLDRNGNPRRVGCALSCRCPQRNRSQRLSVDLVRWLSDTRQRSMNSFSEVCCTMPL